MEAYIKTEVVERLAKLRVDFPPELIGKKPKPTKKQTEEVRDDYTRGMRCDLCGAWHHPQVVHLDYVGHAAVTDRILQVDPFWSWEPLSVDADNLPRLDKNGGLWIKLTICGVTRLGYGHADAKPNGSLGDHMKEVISDALRNGAMRFGVALDLWHKGELHPTPEVEAEAADPGVKDSKPPLNPNQEGVTSFSSEALERGWTIEAQARFVELKDDLVYNIFKQAGKLPEYTKLAEKWTNGKNHDQASAVLGGMEKVLLKAQKAAGVGKEKS
ncbi:MAG: hypothetical protein KGN80_00195 [Acidobacteriota bacterium]|nr:hypothetical protein [Acidobacteriota bacterium]